MANNALRLEGTVIELSDIRTQSQTGGGPINQVEVRRILIVLGLGEDGQSIQLYQPAHAASSVQVGQSVVLTIGDALL